MICQNLFPWPLNHVVLTNSKQFRQVKCGFKSHSDFVKVKINFPAKTSAISRTFAPAKIR